jgi:hypothetical protein
VAGGAPIAAENVVLVEQLQPADDLAVQVARARRPLHVRVRAKQFYFFAFVVGFLFIL